MEREHLMVLRDIAKFGITGISTDKENAIIAAEKELIDGCGDLDKEIDKTVAAIQYPCITSACQDALAHHLSALLATKRDTLGIKGAA